MSKSQTRNHGKFWPRVRPLIWEKAQQLYQEEQAKTMGTDYKGITATHKELREAGYFHTAKLITLRNLYLQNKTSPAPYKKFFMASCTREKSKPKNKRSAKTKMSISDSSPCNQ